MLWRGESKGKDRVSKNKDGSCAGQWRKGKKWLSERKKTAEIKQQKKSQRHLRAFFEEKELQLNKNQVFSLRNTGVSERESEVKAQ